MAPHGIASANGVLSVIIVDGRATLAIGSRSLAHAATSLSNGSRSGSAAGFAVTTHAHIMAATAEWLVAARALVENVPPLLEPTAGGASRFPPAKVAQLVPSLDAIIRVGQELSEVHGYVITEAGRQFNIRQAAQYAAMRSRAERPKSRRRTATNFSGGYNSEGDEDCEGLDDGDDGPFAAPSGSTAKDAEPVVRRTSNRSRNTTKKGSDDYEYVKEDAAAAAAAAASTAAGLRHSCARHVCAPPRRATTTPASLLPPLLLLLLTKLTYSPRLSY